MFQQFLTLGNCVQVSFLIFLLIVLLVLFCLTLLLFHYYYTLRRKLERQRKNVVLLYNHAVIPGKAVYSGLLPGCGTSPSMISG